MEVLAICLVYAVGTMFAYWLMSLFVPDEVATGDGIWLLICLFFWWIIVPVAVPVLIFRPIVAWIEREARKRVDRNDSL